MPTARLIENRGPLAGASVVVTRPAATAAALRRRIRALGGHPLGLPGSVLRAAPDRAAVQRALAHARTAELVIFVSPAAVRYAFAAQPKLRFARSTRVAAVGTGTTRALARRGIKAVLHPRARQDSEGLLALPELHHLRGARVALIGAPDGRELLQQSLRARHARVIRIDVYQRHTPPFSQRQLAALERAPAPLLTLVSSAQTLLRLRDDLPLWLFARLAAGHLIVSSARLAQIARASEFSSIDVAAGPSPQSLLNGACAVLARHRL
jgi:uroporphyrinogen-III synthase